MRDIYRIKNGTRHGVIEMPRDAYFAADGLNPSSIADGRKSMLHLKDSYEASGKEPTANMVFGSLVHILLLEPHKLSDITVHNNEGEFVCIWEDRRSGKSWKLFQEKHRGKLIVSDSQYQRAMDLLRRAVTYPRFMELVEEGVAEQSIFTVECGMQCRGMVDWISTNTATLVDIKTAANIQSHAFGRSYCDLGYDLKMACYKRWLEREANIEIKEVVLVTIESSPPYDLATVHLPVHELDYGWEQADRIIHQVEESLATRDWPGIANDEPYALERPAYSIKDENEWKM